MCACVRARVWEPLVIVALLICPTASKGLVPSKYRILFALWIRTESASHHLGTWSSVPSFGLLGLLRCTPMSVWSCHSCCCTFSAGPCCFRVPFSHEQSFFILRYLTESINQWALADRQYWGAELPAPNAPLWLLFFPSLLGRGTRHTWFCCRSCLLCWHCWFTLSVILAASSDL